MPLASFSSAAESEGLVKGRIRIPGLALSSAVQVLPGIPAANTRGRGRVSDEPSREDDLTGEHRWTVLEAGTEGSPELALLCIVFWR